jgi:putative nucleotidyltransferase with HDIG domain
MSSIVEPGVSLSSTPHILVVDDEYGIRDFCVRALRKLGYEVTAAENGRVGLEFLDKQTFDLVLTDLQMPEMNGIAMLRRLRERYPDTDVVVFTAYGTFETAREALRLGAADYLTKPVSLDDLQCTVRRVLEWRRVRQEKQRLSEIVSLYELSQTFTRTLDVTTAVSEITRLLSRRFSPRTLSISLLHPDDHELELLTQIGSVRNTTPGARESISGRDELAVIKGHFRLVGAPDSLDPARYICVVLRANDRIVGILELARDADQPSFGSDDRLMLNVCASQIASALENIRLYQQLKEQNLQTISALVSAIEKRDPYTSGHSHQVMIYSVRLAEVVNLSPQRVENIRYGALLHDIGKIGIRDYILLKPGPLNTEEMAIMQQHPKIGADILRHIKALREVIPLIECHHERMDGRGYPMGRPGAQLSDEVRILSIADAFDAMTTDRAYRKAMSKEQSFQILRDGRNTHWDGALVDTFIDMMIRESEHLVGHQPRPAQLAVDGLLGRPTLVSLEPTE